MPNGDAAAALGWPVMNGSEDRRLGYEEINKTRDLAAGVKTEARPVSAGGTGATTASGARTNLGVQATVDAVANASATASDGVLVKGGSGGRINVGDPTAGTNAANKNYVDNNDSSILGVAQDALNGELNSAVYNRDITSTRRACWIRSDGTLGYASSSRYKKQNMRPAELSIDAIRAIPVLLYRYRAAAAIERKGGAKAPTEIGTIAEDLHTLGLWPFVMYEAGKPIGVHYELLSLAALSLAQDLADRVDAIEARLDAIERGA